MPIVPPLFAQGGAANNATIYAPSVILQFLWSWNDSPDTPTLPNFVRFLFGAAMAGMVTISFALGANSQQAQFSHCRL